MRDDGFRVLLTAEFATPASSWTEHLCVQRVGEQLVLSSCGYEILGELSQFAVEDADGNVEYSLPESIDGQAVVGTQDGEYVIGGDLVPQDDDAEIRLEPGETEEAREWLEGREWHLKPGFEGAWREICRMLEAETGAAVSRPRARSEVRHSRGDHGAEVIADCGAATR